MEDDEPMRYLIMGQMMGKLETLRREAEQRAEHAEQQLALMAKRLLDLAGRLDDFGRGDLHEVVQELLAIAAIVLKAP